MRRPQVRTLLVLFASCGSDPVGTDLVDANQSVDAPPADAATSCAEPFATNPAPPASPPYQGTVYIDPAMLTESDPTSFRGVTYWGTGERTMYDRRVNDWVTLQAHLFQAQFGSDISVEVQVNPEMTMAEAQTEAIRYATAVGRIPAFLFRDLETMWIHRGNSALGGGNHNFLIHTEFGQQLIDLGFLEEGFIHEGAHTSLDADHAASPRWLAAKAADGGAISEYARDNTASEDVSESLGPYLAQRFWADRMQADDLAKIRGAIPARLAYFDCLDLSIAPPE